MKNHFSLLPLLLIISPLLLSPIGVEGGKRKIHTTDDLDDVVDNEEDEVWKEWGKKKSSEELDLPLSHFDNMELSQIQEGLMKRLERVHIEPGRGVQNKDRGPSFQKPGNPPVEVVAEKLRRSKKKEEIEEHVKEL